jgi:hypothetical protein
MVTNRPSYEQFAALMAENVKEGGLSASLSYDSDSFALVEAGANAEPLQRMLLGHYFGEYCALDTSEKPAFLARVKQLWNEQAFPANFADAQSNLMPHLIDRWSVFRTNMNLALGMAKELEDAHVDVTPDFAPFVVIADAFAMVLALDLKTTRLIVTHRQLAAWGIEFEKAIDTAYQNLVSRSGGEFEMLVDQDTGLSSLYSSTWHDGYDSSRVLIDDLLTQFNVRGEHVIGIPDNNQMLVTGSDDSRGLTALYQMVSDARALPQALPPVLIHKSANGLTRYEAPLLDPLKPLLRNLETGYLSDIYASQKALLLSSMDVAGLPILDFERRENFDVEESFSTWTTVPVVQHALVPQTDFVSFVEEKDGTARVLAEASFARVQEVLGENLIDVQQYPVRFLLRSYPTAEQLAQLGKKD